jgi:hypothetical protein
MYRCMSKEYKGYTWDVCRRTKSIREGGAQPWCIRHEAFMVTESGVRLWLCVSCDSNSQSTMIWTRLCHIVSKNCWTRHCERFNDCAILILNKTARIHKRWNYSVSRHWVSKSSSLRTCHNKFKFVGDQNQHAHTLHARAQFERPNPQRIERIERTVLPMKVMHYVQSLETALASYTLLY